MLSWGRSINGQFKTQSPIMLEDYEEAISLTLKDRSSRKPLRMQEENWKHQWLQPCLGRHARNVSRGRPVARLMISSPNLRVSWKPVNPQECVWKNLYQNIMRTILQKKGEGDRWSKDICHLKNAELEAKHQKYNGRVVLRGDIVEDDSGSYAVFTEQGSSASQMTAAKIMDIISRLPGCAGQAADAVSAFTQVKMELLPNYWKFQNWNVQDISIRLSRHKWPTSWSSMEDPVVPLERNLYRVLRYMVRFFSQNWPFLLRWMVLVVLVPLPCCIIWCPERIPLQKPNKTCFWGEKSLWTREV